MSRDVSGRYTLPSGYRAEDGVAAVASQHNLPLEDIAEALTGSLARNGAGSMSGNLNMGSNRVVSLTDGSASTDAATKGQLDAAVAAIASQLLPPGVVSFTAGEVAPTGWLLASGLAVSRTTYANLFAVIGVIYGAGDGSTTFNLPDLRGEFLRGWDMGRGVDATRTLGSAQASALGSHTHTATVTDPGHTHTTPTFAQDGANGAGSGARFSLASTNTGVATTGIVVSITATGASETRPRNIALTPIIKF